MSIFSEVGHSDYWATLQFIDLCLNGNLKNSCVAVAFVDSLKVMSL